jgi:hypothetical protein
MSSQAAEKHDRKFLSLCLHGADQSSFLKNYNYIWNRKTSPWMMLSFSSAFFGREKKCKYIVGIQGRNKI